ncbi:MAG: signal peptide peptidase SppA [bacterium]
MISIIILIVAINPFYEANFSSLPMRSISVFSNPAGLGINRGAEIFGIYHPDPDIITVGLSLSSLGLGMIKELDSTTVYEVGVGYKLPGAFSLGYAYQFGDASNNFLGIECRATRKLTLGYKTTLGEKYHMFGGISIRPFEEYLTLSCDLEYEGIDSIFTYYWGAMFIPTEGLKMHFQANEDFDWQAGLEISVGKMKLAGSYCDAEEKISGGIMFSAQSYESLLPKKNRISSLTLSGNYPEIKRKTFFGIPLKAEQGFTKLLNDLRYLRTQNHIPVIVVKIKSGGLGSAQIEELGDILSELKDSGKRIVFFADNYQGTLLYGLACTGNEIILSPLGTIKIPGLAMRKPYIKGTLEKLGIEFDISHAGKYKSAVEIFERTSMSEADREQISKILDDFYYPVLNKIAKGRAKSPEEVEELINDAGYFNSDEAIEHGLIDTMLYEFELEDYLHEKYGKMSVVDFGRIVNEDIVTEQWQTDRPEIALVIAEGSIVPGQGKPDLFQSSLIGGERYAKILNNLAKNNNIKAVILRINSGGGDAFASEEIAYAVEKCVAVKPVIVSMGDVAGSGGYYIACLADKIYANNNTITGSIGVFGLNPVTKGLYDKIGITWDYVKKGEHSDAYWGLRHLNEEEMEKFDKEVLWYYDRFTKRVAEGRQLTQDKVDSLGQGRIYSGKHAQEIGLVDVTGGFLDALEAAKELSGIKGDVEIIVYTGSDKFSILNKTSMLSDILFRMPDYEVK